MNAKPEILSAIATPPADFSYGTQRYYVYFMQTATVGAIKLGIAWNIGYRFTSIQTGNHEKVSLVGWISFPDKALARKAERALHIRFASHLLRGEWFHPHKDVIQYIRDLRAENGT